MLPSVTQALATWLDDGARSHGEVGYWRAVCDRVELVLSLQNGVVGSIVISRSIHRR